MSMAELDRFTRDVSQSSDLPDAIKTLDFDDTAVTEFAQSEGYDFTLERQRNFGRTRSGN